MKGIQRGFKYLAEVWEVSLILCKGWVDGWWGLSEDVRAVRFKMKKLHWYMCS